jgi:hypothetical protein
MTIELNHTLVHVRDLWRSAHEVGGVLGLPEPTSYGPFAVLRLDNGASLDFLEDSGDIAPQHYAFLVGEDDFDAIWGRIRDQGRQFWADPFKQHPGAINHGDGGRGLYWEGPDGHWLEIITRPYGSSQASSTEEGEPTSPDPSRTSTGPSPSPFTSSPARSGCMTEPAGRPAVRATSTSRPSPTLPSQRP